jgi:hypothetical protein
MHKGFWWGNLKEKPFGDLGVDEKIVLRRILTEYFVDWIELSQTRESSRLI